MCGRTRHQTHGSASSTGTRWPPGAGSLDLSTPSATTHVTTSILAIESEGAFSATNIGFRGSLYGATSINLGGGQASAQGLLVSPELIVPDSSSI